MSIPAKKLAQVLPGVIGVGGAALALSGLMLTSNAAVPIGAVKSFADAPSVSAFFGPLSDEYALASNYFTGYDNATQRPGALLFAQYPLAAVAAYVRGASLASMTLAQLQAIPAGTMSIAVNGVTKNSTSISLATASSFSNAAALISAGFTGGPTVTYDTQRAAFVFTSTSTGPTSTIAFPSSSALATALNLTQATGAVTSQGAAAAAPSAAMDSISSIARNWASFTTVFEPAIADKIAFATWTHQQNDRFAYMCWDTDATAAQQGNTSAFGPQVAALGLSGSVPFSADPAQAAALGVTMQSLVRPLAAFGMGYMASIDFNQTNGRTVFAFRSQGGLVAGVEDGTVAATLAANGYNFYGDYATSQQAFRFLQPGQISGRFAWLDSFANEVWMNANFQQALMSFMASANSIPYNPDGYAAIETVLQTPINRALNFGAIRSGVVLAGSQIVSVNSATGKKIDTVLASRGWYLDVRDPGPSARAARGTPLINFFYMDGGSVQQMSMASLLVQ